MKPEGPTKDGVPNKVGFEEALNESKNKDEEIPAEFLNKINIFFEIHNSFLYEDVIEDEISFDEYLSADPASEVNIAGNCLNQKEIVEDEKCYSTNSQKLYSSLKRYCLRNVKEKSDLSSENGILSTLSAKKSLLNQHTEIEKNITIPDSYQLPLSNETRSTVTFDTSLSENSAIDIKFPLCDSFSLSQDLTEAQRSVRLNKKSTLKKNIKKLMNEKICKTEESISKKETVPRDAIREFEKPALKRNNRKSMNDKMTLSHGAEKCYNPNEMVSREMINKPDVEDKKSTLKKNKKSTNDKMTMLHLTEECHNSNETVSREVTEKPVVEDKKSTFKKNNKKSASGKMTMLHLTEECYNSNEMVSREVIEEPEVADKKSTFKKNNKKSTNEKVTMPHVTEESLNPKTIVSRDVIENPNLENKINSTLKKSNKKSVNNKMKVSSKTEECFSSKELISSDLTEKPVLENIKKNITKPTNKKMLTRSKTDECLNSEEIVHEDHIGKTKIETRKRTLRNKNTKNSTNDKIIPCKTKKCFNPKQIVSRGTTEKPELMKKITLRKNSKKAANGKIIPNKTEECVNPNKITSKGAALIHDVKINSKFNVYYGVASNKEQLKHLRVCLTDCIGNSQNFKKDLKNENDILCFEKALSKFTNKAVETNKFDIRTRKEETLEDISKKVLDKSISGKHSKRNKTLLPDIKNSKTNNFEKDKKKSFTPDDVKNTFMNHSMLSENGTPMVEKKLFKKNKLRISDHVDEKSFVEPSLKRNVTRKKSTSLNSSKTKGNINKKSLLKETITQEDKDILSESDIVEERDLSVNYAENDLNKNEIVTAYKNLKQKENSKTTQQILTRTPDSQKSSVKNMFDCLNKNASSSSFSETSQKNSSNFLQLFNKVIESRSSETVSKSNHSIAKLFEPHNSKLESTSKICKELDQKQNPELLLQPSSFKEKSDVPSGKKRSNEDNNENLSKKKKSNDESVEINSDKNFEDETLFIKDAEDHDTKRAKTTKKQLLKGVAVNKPSRKGCKTNKKLEKEHSGIACKLPDPLKVVSTKFPIHKRKTLKETTKNINSSESDPIDKSANVMKLNSKRSPKKKKCTTAKSINPHRLSKKTDSLISTEPECSYNAEGFDACDFIISNVKSLAPGAGEGDNENWEEKDASFSENPKVKKRSRKEPFDSVQENRELSSQHQSSFNSSGDAAQPEENESMGFNSIDKTRAKRQRKSTFVDPNFYYEKNSRTKKENKSFCNVKLEAVVKKTRKNERFEEINSIPEMTSTDTVLEENTNDSTIQNCDDKDLFNLNSNGIPMSSWTSNQMQNFLSSYTLYPINPQCKLLYDSARNRSMLAVPVQPIGNVPVLTPNMTVSDTSPAPQLQFQIQNYPVQNFPVSQFISSPQYMNPMLISEQNYQPAVNSPRATSIVTGQTTPSILVSNGASTVLASQTVPSLVSTNNGPLSISNRNPVYKIEPPTVLSAVNPQTISVQRSDEFSGNLHHGFMTVPVLQCTVGGIATKHIKESEKTEKVVKNEEVHIQNKDTTLNIVRKATQNDEAYEIKNSRNIKQPDDMTCNKWRFFVKDTFAGLDIVSITKTSKKLFGKHCESYTVREFCCIPEVSEEITKILDCCIADMDNESYGYEFHNSFLDEACIYVLKDFVQFHLEHIYCESHNKSGDELSSIYFGQLYTIFSLPVLYYISLVLQNSTDYSSKLSIEKIASAFSLVGFIYIFYNFQKRF